MSLNTLLRVMTALDTREARSVTEVMDILASDPDAPGRRTVERTLAALEASPPHPVQRLEGSPQRWRLRVERESLRQPALQDKLQAALAELLGTAVLLELEAGLAQDSPALRDQSEVQARQRRAEQIVLEDPLVQQPGFHRTAAGGRGVELRHAEEGRQT